MKLNELVCPNCGLRCFTDASYTTCASCNTHFYAAQSRSVDCPQPFPYITIGPLPINPQPVISPQPIWVAPFGPPGSPYGPTVICETSIGGSLVIDDSEGCQVWNSSN